MTIPEAAQLVIQAGAMGQGGEIFVLDMGEPVRIVDLAPDMIRLSGLRVGEDIEIEFTGLRPGEKLYEELHVAGETTAAHPPPQDHRGRSQAGARRRHSRRDRGACMTCQRGPQSIVGRLQQIVCGYPPELRQEATPWLAAA